MDAILPTDFENHHNYLQKWEFLFKYELYSMLMNSR
jgi:hypothetical protein